MSPLKELQYALAEVRAQIKRLRADLVWHEGFDVQAAQRDEPLRKELVVAEKKLAEAQDALNKAHAAQFKYAMEARSYEFKYPFIGKLHPMAFYSRHKEQEAETEALLAEMAHTTMLHKRNEIKRRLSGVSEAELRRYRSFDRAATVNKLTELESQAEHMQELYERMVASRTPIHDKIDELREQIISMKAEHVEVSGKVALARRLDKQLNLASNTKADRRNIHEQAKQELDNPNPQAAQRFFERKAEGIARSIQKIEKRIVRLERASRIKHLIIDGNNLCYNANNDCIKLRVLDALIPVLTQKYQVTLVFDPTIVEDSGMGSRQAIIEHFNALAGPAGIDAQIAHAGADSLIIQYANIKEEAFIISNDTFAEFFNEKAIKTARVMHHRTIGDVLMIEDLALELEIEPEPQVA